MNSTRFLLYSSFSAVSLLGISYLSKQFLFPEISFPATLVAVGVALVTTLIAYYINSPNLTKANVNFISAMLVGMGLKMVIGLISIIIVALKFQPSLIEYVVAYIISYFIFTAFEVYSLMRKLRA